MTQQWACGNENADVEFDNVFSDTREIQTTLHISDVCCPVCMAVTANPQLTMCGHRLCMDCAKRLIGPGGGSLKCPTCNQVTNGCIVPDYRTRDIVMSQTVVCGHEGCDERCSLRDVVEHMKQCRHRKTTRRVLNGAVKRCRGAIDTLKRSDACKRRRYAEVHRAVVAYNDSMMKARRATAGGGGGGGGKAGKKDGGTETEASNSAPCDVSSSAVSSNSNDANKVGVSDISLANACEGKVKHCGDGATRAAGAILMVLKRVVGEEKFTKLYMKERADYHQSLLDKVKVATPA